MRAAGKNCKYQDDGGENGEDGKKTAEKKMKTTNDHLRCWFVDGSTWNGLYDREKTSIGMFR